MAINSIRIEKINSFNVFGYSVTNGQRIDEAHFYSLWKQCREDLLSLAGGEANLYGIIKSGGLDYVLGLSDTTGSFEGKSMQIETIPAASYAVAILEGAKPFESWPLFTGSELPDRGYIVDWEHGGQFELYKHGGGVELWAPVVSDQPMKDTLRAFSNIGGVDIEPALKRLRGVQNVLELSVRATGKSLAERADKSEFFLANGKMEDFAVTVHGLKGSLATIGANALADWAAKLEKEARTGRDDCCRENFPEFAVALREMGDKIGLIFIDMEF